MYASAVLLHSILRWIVLVAGITAIIRAIRGRAGSLPWSAFDDRLGLGFIASVDLQLLVGLVLFLYSPITVLGRHELEIMMGSRILRFFTLEHPLMMTIATVIAHVARVRIRRRAQPRDRHHQAVVWFGLAILIMLA